MSKADIRQQLEDVGKWLIRRTDPVNLQFEPVAVLMQLKTEIALTESDLQALQPQTFAASTNGHSVGPVVTASGTFYGQRMLRSVA